MLKEPEYRPLVPKDVPYVAGTQEAEPKDKYNAAWFIFLILGTGLLIPWNAFINASAYFTSIYPDFSAFIFFLSLVYNWSSCLSLVLSIKVAPRFSIGSRIIVFFLMDLVMLIAVPFINDMFHHQTTSIIITYVACFFTGMASSILFGTVFGLSALFPPEYAGAIMSGNGIAGVLCSVLSIITQVAEPNTTAGHRTSGLLFFIFASATILLCIVSYFVLMRLPITIYHMKRYQATKEVAGTERERLINNEPRSSWRNNSQDGSSPVTVKGVFRKIWLESLTVWSVFFVTLALFPGIALTIAAPHGLKDWFAIIMVTIFTVGDYIGRTLPKWLVLFNPRTLVPPVMVRYIFFVLFPLCIKPDLISSQWAVYIIMAIFALTNGYLGTLAMMFGPTKVNTQEKETAGFIMTFSLNFGIFCGVHFAILLLYIITGSIGF